MNFETFSKEKLYELTIHNLRRLGSSIGVKAPSSLSKDRLIESIYSIVSGVSLPYTQKDKRGRPTKSAVEPIVGGGFKTTFELDGLNFGFGLGNVATQASPYVFGSHSSNNKAGIFMEKGEYSKICKYPYVESEDDAYISKELVSDYDLHPFDVVSYVLVENSTVKEVSSVVEVNGRKITDYEVMFNRLDRLGLGKNKIAELNVKLGGKYLLPCGVKSANSSESDKIINLLDKEKYSVVRLSLDKQQVSQIDNIKSFNSFVIDNSKVSVQSCANALVSAKTLATEGKNVVMVIDNLSSLISAYKENYSDNFGVFVKRLLFSAGTFSNGSSITILCLVSGEKLDSLAVQDFVDYFDKTLNL